MSVKETIEAATNRGIRASNIGGNVLVGGISVSKDGRPGDEGASIVLVRSAQDAHIQVPVLSDVVFSMEAAVAQGSRTSRRHLDREMRKVVACVLVAIRQAGFAFGSTFRVEPMTLGIWLPTSKAMRPLPGTVTVPGAEHHRVMLNHALRGAVVTPAEAEFLSAECCGYTAALVGKTDEEACIAEIRRWMSDLDVHLLDLRRDRAEYLKGRLVLAIQALLPDYDQVEDAAAIGAPEA